MMSDPAITTKATRSWWSTILKRFRTRGDRLGMGAKKRRDRDCSDWRTWKSCRASASSGRIGLRWAADPSLRAMSASQWDGYEGAVGADRRRFARGPSRLSSMVGSYPRRARVDGIHVPHTVLIDRKSTRLNSSHVAISYAVFCLNKKN